MATKPTHEQAQLQLQIYDMRREAKLRQARDWFFKNYFVETVDDAMRIAAPGSEGGTFVGMVLGYWERCQPIVPQVRERFAYKGYLANMEQAAQRYEKWIESRSPGHIAKMREFMKQMQAQLKKA